MRLRIALWALAGTLIAAAWAVYASAVGPIAMVSQPAIWSFARLTCPLVIIAGHFHSGVSLLSTLIANAITYGLLGLLLESVRRPINLAR